MILAVTTQNENTKFYFQKNTSNSQPSGKYFPRGIWMETEDETWYQFGGATVEGVFMKRPPEVTYGRRQCGHVLLRLSSCDSVSDACHIHVQTLYHWWSEHVLLRPNRLCSHHESTKSPSNESCRHIFSELKGLASLYIYKWLPWNHSNIAHFYSGNYTRNNFTRNTNLLQYLSNYTIQLL